MPQKKSRLKFIALAVIFNIMVLAVLIGISFLLIHVFLRGKLTPPLISIFASIFFVCAVLSTSLSYRFYMRYILKVKSSDDLFTRSFKKVKTKKSEKN